MSLEMYFICFGVGCLGILFRILAGAVQIDKKMRLAEKSLNFIDYVKTDWLSTVLSLVALLIVLVCIDEVFKWKPWVIDYAKNLFVFVGYGFGDILVRLFGAYSNKANKILVNFENDTKNEKV